MKTIVRSLVYHTKSICDPAIYVGKPGELTVDQDGNIYMHDGSTAGGLIINKPTADQIVAALGYTPADENSAQPMLSPQSQIAAQTSNNSNNTTNNTMDGGFF